MKIGKEGLSAPQIAALRIFSASIIFLPFAFYYFSKLPKKKIGLVVLTGLFGNLIPAFLFAWAIMKLDSSVVGILNSLTPISVALLGVMFFRATIRKQQIIGILVGFGGLCLLTFSQNEISLDNLGYSFLVLLATISYGLNVNIVSYQLKGVNAVHAASVSLAFLSVPTALILWHQGFFALDFTDATIKWSVIASLLLGIVGSALATVLFYMLVQRAGGLFASLVTYGIPFVAVFWGVIYEEHITAVQMIALGIILAGVYLANRSPKKAVTTKEL
jgi:drug/metabolite transporter (DMT)-like permease